MVGPSCGFADQTVTGTMEAVGDSLVVVKLYVGKLASGVWTNTATTIDSLTMPLDSVTWRTSIRMTSGWFDGNPQKNIVVAYNLPDTGQLITIRVFRLDSTTYAPIEICSVRDAPLPDSMGVQAFFDVAAGDFDGDGRDELVTSGGIHFGI